MCGAIKIDFNMLLKYGSACFYSCSLFASTIQGPLIEDMSKIEGGQPPICSIQKANNTEDELCSATLIDKRHVLTAAHCVDNIISGQTKVFCDYDSINKVFKEVFNLKSIYKSEKYQKPKMIFPGGGYFANPGNNISTFDFAIAELDGESKLYPVKMLENLKYLQKLIKDERRYVYVVNNGGLRLLENDTTCYAAGYASGRLDVGELKTWANRNESTPDYKLKSEWSYKDKKNAADIMGEPTNYSLVTVKNRKGVFFPLDNLTQRKEWESLVLRHEVQAVGEDVANKKYPLLDFGDSGGPLFCKKSKETQWTLIGVASISDRAPIYDEWAILGTVSFKKMLINSNYKIDKADRYYGEKR